MIVLEHSESSSDLKSDPLLDELRTPPEPKEHTDRAIDDTHPRDEPPPMYTPTPSSNEQGPPDIAPDMAAQPSPPRLGSPPPKPMNLISVTKLNGALRGRWVVDPSLLIPPPFLPPLSVGETERKNLHIKTHNGAIAAEVTIVPRSSAPDGRARVTVHASTFNGSVKFTLREANMAGSAGKLGTSPTTTTTTTTTGRLPVKIKLDSLNGAIYASIPRSFRGIIVGSTFNGHTKLSRAVQEQVQHDKEDARSRRLFLGEFMQGDYAESGYAGLGGGGFGWRGDELNAETKSGHIIIRYEDEVEYTEESGRPKPPSLISKIWNAIF